MTHGRGKEFFMPNATGRVYHDAPLCVRADLARPHASVCMRLQSIHYPSVILSISKSKHLSSSDLTKIRTFWLIWYVLCCKTTRTKTRWNCKACINKSESVHVALAESHAKSTVESLESLSILSKKPVRSGPEYFFSQRSSAQLRLRAALRPSRAVHRWAIRASCIAKKRGICEGTDQVLVSTLILLPPIMQLMKRVRNDLIDNTFDLGTLPS